MRFVTLVNRGTFATIVGLACVARPATAFAQGVGQSTNAVVDVDSDLENYLRILQLRGAVPPAIWSVREFGARELAALVPGDSLHPWHNRLRRASAASRPSFEWLGADVQLIENTGFPYGFNDGPVWAGKGLTVVAALGGVIRYRWLSAEVRPMLFRAMNSAFPLAPNGQSGNLVFADPVSPLNIDQPQRFGSGAYQQLDAGQSSVRLELPLVTIGLSNANQHWGPAVVHPLILGNNAAGFPHLFVGTTGDLNLGIVTLRARLEAGRLDQSAFADTSAPSRRLATGAAVAISPRWARHLELGASRFFHSAWPAGGVRASDVFQPARHFFGSGGSDQTNQLASVFARLTVPQAHVEVYAEYARDDANIDRRDLTLEPDHISGYVLGLQRSWDRTGGGIFVVRAEGLNARVTHLEFGRPQAPFYVHTVITQGHTERGQILGSPAAYGGSALNLAFESYDRTGKWAVTWDRAVREPPNALIDTGTNSDVQYTVGARRTGLHRLADVSLGVLLTRELNRRPSADATNLRVEAGLHLP